MGNSRSNRFTQATLLPWMGLLGRTELALANLVERTLLSLMGLPGRTELIRKDL